ncbi:hypothetical protein SAMN05421505_14731 [Sinosporangium album]|uniref:Uncharacterized protein n=1 Tax=Sinosporangium album TaxID=504805 RepID=A0A1G8K4U9_9ACTN|nr:hypothetical protein SAMN05421505_14731 [Sinosporangium album]
MKHMTEAAVTEPQSQRPRFMNWREEVAADKERRAEAGRKRDLAMLRRIRLSVPEP